MKAVTANAREDEFDAVLVAELDTLRRGEQHLQYLFSKLRTEPELRDSFMLELAAIQQRAGRLDAVLSPVDALHARPSFFSPNANPAA